MKKVNVSVAGEKGVLFKIKKGDAFRLNEVLSGVKITNLTKEGAFALLNVKIALSDPVRTIKDAQKQAIEDLKPSAIVDGVKNPALEREWDKKFSEFMDRYLDEEIEIKLSPISQDDLYELVKENSLELGKAEILNVLVK